MSEHRASRSAREEVLRRMFELPWRDMYEAWTVVGSYLNANAKGGEGKEFKLLREKAEALDDLAAAALALRTPAGEWPKVDDYQRVAKELGLSYSSQKIIRRWGLWEDAGRELAGHRRTGTPHQRAIRRATTGKQRSHEERLTGVRNWLDDKPASRTRKDYDEWVETQNLGLPEGQLPYIVGNSIEVGLCLSWDWVLAVATYECELPAAQAAYLEELTAASGPLRLVGMRGIGLLLATTATHAAELVLRSGFPVHAADIANVRAWHRDDVEAHLDGGQAKTRVAGELNERILDSSELCVRLDMRPNTLISAIHRGHTQRVPRPAGVVSHRYYWMRDEVERWLTEHPTKDPGNPHYAPPANRPAKTAPPAAKYAKKSR